MSGQANLEADFQVYLKKNDLQGNYQVQGQEQILSLKGQAAHGSGPDKGINAAIYLTHFLRTLDLDPAAQDYLALLDDYFFADSFGQKLGLAYEDQELGKVTVNPAIFSFENGQAKIGINLRYPQMLEYSTLGEQ